MSSAQRRRTRRQGVAGHANCLSVPNRASEMLPCARLRAQAWRASTSRRGLDCARSKNHDARGDFASTRNGANACEASNYRSGAILIEPSCSDARQLARRRASEPAIQDSGLVKRRCTLSRGGTSPSGICDRRSAGGARNQRPYWPTLFNFTVVFGLFWIVWKDHAIAIGEFERADRAGSAVRRSRRRTASGSP